MADNTRVTLDSFDILKIISDNKNVSSIFFQKKLKFIIICSSDLSPCSVKLLIRYWAPCCANSLPVVIITLPAPAPRGAN